MGRELNMVPANWEHPKEYRNSRHGLELSYKPMYQGSFREASEEWKKEFRNWDAGKYPDYTDESDQVLEYWEWSGMPPDPEMYLNWTDEDRVWFQIWETVSEGTPVSPAFETKEELIDYLTENGDFWDQKRGDKPASRASYTALVNGSYAPSFILDKGKLMSGVEYVGIET